MLKHRTSAPSISVFVFSCRKLQHEIFGTNINKQFQHVYLPIRYLEQNKRLEILQETEHY
jgi:hypothetical protein